MSLQGQAKSQVWMRALISLKLVAVESLQELMEKMREKHDCYYLELMIQTKVSFHFREVLHTTPQFNSVWNFGLKSKKPHSALVVQQKMMAYLSQNLNEKIPSLRYYLVSNTLSYGEAFLRCRGGLFQHFCCKGITSVAAGR